MWDQNLWSKLTDRATSHFYWFIYFIYITILLLMKLSALISEFVDFFLIVFLRALPPLNILSCLFVCFFTQNGLFIPLYFSLFAVECLFFGVFSLLSLKKNGKAKGMWGTKWKDLALVIEFAYLRQERELNVIVAILELWSSRDLWYGKVFPNVLSCAEINIVWICCGTSTLMQKCRAQSRYRGISMTEQVWHWVCQTSQGVAKLLK